MRDTTPRTHGFNVETLIETLEPIPETFASPEDNGHNRYMHVVDQVGVKKRANRRRSSADSDVQTACRFPCNLKSLRGSRVDEVECRPAFHVDCVTRVVGEDKYGCVKRWIVSPPSAPVLVSPRPALVSELIASHDLGADAGTPLTGKSIVDSGTSSIPSLYCMEGFRRKEPFVKPVAGMSEWCFVTLAVTGAEAVERNREVVDPNAGLHFPRLRCAHASNVRASSGSS